MKIKLLLAFAFVFVSNHSFSGAPQCYSSYGGYCEYDGFVERIYVNSGNLILIYFDTPMASGETKKAGIASAELVAAMVDLGKRPDFAKLLYSTALSAQATGRKISLQMHSASQGYLEADRIWLSKP